ncbi:uncharacterized protein LOC129585471 [Paramacrobiotus metropolitanus]|uniref:uncharacterized protein LOC129585471 n=1 Tax=Paramacrobiotus metropolitanus TaxID=2943436 RepID=UPI0024465C21|nr:uncharacterized protein LOC129585471 [Paramacrobiotus metropolitanus]XP_055334134.1 uncharacterized protein LOC129585471 [Paramacrobiotus metropolitanus]
MAVSESNVCAVLQCPLSKPSHGVSDVWYFDVPPVTDPKYSRWIEILSKGRDSQWSPTPSTKVCSRHFSTGTVLPTPADQSGKRGKRLKKGACPYVVDAEVMVAESRISTSDPLASPSTSASTSVLVSDNGETGPPAKKQRVDAVDPSIPEKPIEDTNSLPPVLPTQSVDAINNPTPVPTIQCALPPPAPPIQPVQEPSPCQLGLAPKLPKLAPKKPGLSAARQPSTSASLPASPLSMVPANPADEPATSGGDTAVEACCVPGCTISSANAMAQAVTLHAFRPSTHPFYETWTQRLRCAATWTPKSTDVICSQHFEPGDFLHHDVNTGELLAQRQLKDDAMPSHLAGIIDFHYSGVYTRHEDVSGIMQCMVCHASRKPGQTKPSERLKFYPFPTGANTRRGWMNFLKQNGRVQVVTDRSLVCENHFTPDDYALGPTSGVLKSRAVPSWTLRIQLQYPPPTVKSDSEIGCTAMCKSEEIRSIKSPIISAQNVTARTDGVLEDGQNLVAKNLERVTPLTDMDVRVSREDPGLRPIDDNVTTVEASATTQEIPLLEEKNNADNELSSTSGSSSVAAHPVPVEEQCSKSAVSSEKSATDCASFYCEKCKISLRNPCWLHAVSFPDEPTTPLAISSLP